MSAIIRKSVSTLGIPILLLAACSERTASEAPADAPETTDVVGAVNFETCEHCGGAVKIIACIEDPAVIRKILEHRKRKCQHAPRVTPQASRAPPATLPLVLD